MRDLRRWVLYNECAVCDCRRRNVLGVYPTRCGEVAGVAVEGMEVG